MAALAAEYIMLLIFEQLTHVGDAVWPNRVYDQHAAQSPFAVAATCRHWRRLALSTSKLWTYFGFPPAHEMSELHLRRLELLRTRVGDAPIDVVFGWDHPSYAKHACIRNVAPSVFGAILGLHSQWKTVILHIVGSAVRGWTMNPAFQGSHWPLLKSLSLAVDGGLDRLPPAPRLHRLWLDCRDDSVPRPFTVGSYFRAVQKPFTAGRHPALTSLSIWGHSVPVLRDSVHLLGSQLVDLVLLDSNELEPGSTLGVLPALLSLTLDDVRWLHQIDMPALRKLKMTSLFFEDMEWETLHGFDHVQELQLCSRFEKRELAVLKIFSNITTLTFDCPTTLSTAFRQRLNLPKISSEALVELAGSEPSIWPHLERLHFGAALYHSDRDPDKVAQDVVNFVAERNANAARSDGPTMARIVEVVADHPGAPEWLEQRLRELIAENVT